MIRYQPTATPLSRPTPCFRSVTERMADDMRELTFAGQNVSVETLGARGYSADVVKHLGPGAVAMARCQSTKQVV